MKSRARYTDPEYQKNYERALSMSKPIAVLTSDLHFNLTTLPLASAALKAALSKAEELQIPLIIAGDLNDTKAIIRAEVANTIISILKQAKVKVYILAGNHDLVNEKAPEHGLNYLKPYAIIIEGFYDFYNFTDDVVLIPYQSVPPKSFPFKKGRILIMHQGFLGAQMGDYIQDKTSINVSLVKNYTVISGHYHRHQTIGTVTYIGSPYTITFGEANDGPKGFLILNEDGSFTREILNLRKHIIKECTLTTLYEPIDDYNPGDLVWIKVSGTRSELEIIDKKELGFKLFGHANFKLDLYPTEENKQTLEIEHVSDAELLDQIIDNGAESDDEKLTLKSLWRMVIDENT